MNFDQQSLFYFIFFMFSKHCLVRILSGSVSLNVEIEKNKKKKKFVEMNASHPIYSLMFLYNNLTLGMCDVMKNNFYMIFSYFVSMYLLNVHGSLIIVGFLYTIWLFGLLTAQTGCLIIIASVRVTIFFFI